MINKLLDILSINNQNVTKAIVVRLFLCLVGGGVCFYLRDTKLYLEESVIIEMIV